MATNSIYKNISIKKAYDARRLLKALETTPEKKIDPVIIGKKYRELKGDQIRELLEK